MIVEPFNLTFICMFAVALALTALLGAICRKCSEYTRQMVLIALCGLNFLIFCVYKYFLAVDPWYKAQGLFSWWSELPLHLCNINMFLIPIGVLTKKRGLMGFSFFLAPLGALMALVFPSDGFSGFSLAVPRMWGFYATHFLILICGLTLATFDLYRPKIKDIPRITITFLSLAAISFGVNAFLRLVVHCNTANYFFTWTHEDISILKLFWSLIPVRFFYELPALLILFTYIGLVCGVFKIIEIVQKRHERKNIPATAESEEIKETVTV